MNVSRESFQAYRAAYFVDPEPEARFAEGSIMGAVLYFADYRPAVRFYSDVLGQPAYVEGDATRGFRIGSTWLTLLAGGDGAPRNTEINIVMPTPAEAERLQAAFIQAGGAGPAPSDQMMYRPVRVCPVTDPFGTEILISAPLAGGEGN